MNSKKIYSIILFKISLYQARHVIFITIIIIVLLIQLLTVAVEGHQLGAVTELHVRVPEDSEALEEDLLAGNLLLARHSAHLRI